MTRSDALRLADIAAAVGAIQAHTARGGLGDGLVFDAVRMRLLEIGEAVKDLAPTLTDEEPDVEWRAIAGMRDRLAHRYFDTDHAIVQDVVDHELTPLLAAVERLQAQPSD